MALTSASFVKLPIQWERLIQYEDTCGHPEVLWKRPIPVTDLTILLPGRSCLTRQHHCIRGETGPVFSPAD